MKSLAARSAFRSKQFFRFFADHRKKIFLVFFSTLAALLIAEGIVRVFSPDWRLVPRLLRYQNMDPSVHQPDPNPEILFRLKPLSSNENLYLIHINSLGIRGPELGEKKPPGILRIICVGGSNVYGASLSDDETWPAQLEAELNRLDTGRYEVWNMGTPSYVALQMAVVAREAVERYDPDLVIFALSNTGARDFLWGYPVRSYFDKNPGLWGELFSPECLGAPYFLSYKTKLWLVRHVRLYRYLAAYFLPVDSCGGWGNYTHETRNVEAARRFFTWAKGRVKVCVFLTPGIKDDYRRYYAGTGLPVLKLSTDGFPAEYLDIHPPAAVMAWYAREIAKQLIDNYLIPRPPSH